MTDRWSYIPKSDTPGPGHYDVKHKKDSKNVLFTRLERFQKPGEKAGHIGDDLGTSNKMKTTTFDKSMFNLSRRTVVSQKEEQTLRHQLSVMEAKLECEEESAQLMNSLLQTAQKEKEKFEKEVHVLRSQVEVVENELNCAKEREQALRLNQERIQEQDAQLEALRTEHTATLSALATTEARLGAHHSALVDKEQRLDGLAARAEGLAAAVAGRDAELACARADMAAARERVRQAETRAQTAATQTFEEQRHAAHAEAEAEAALEQTAETEVEASDVRHKLMVVSEDLGETRNLCSILHDINYLYKKKIYRCEEDQQYYLSSALEMEEQLKRYKEDSFVADRRLKFLEQVSQRSDQLLEVKEQEITQKEAELVEKTELLQNERAKYFDQVGVVDELRECIGLQDAALASLRTEVTTHQTAVAQAQEQARTQAKAKQEVEVAAQRDTHAAADQVIAAEAALAQARNVEQRMGLELVAQRQRLQAKEEEMQSAAEALQTRELHLEQLNGRMQILQQDLEIKAQECRTFRDQISQLKQELSEKDQALGPLAEQVEVLTRQCTELLAYRDGVRAKEQEMDDVAAKLAALQATNEWLLKENRARDTLIEQLGSANSELSGHSNARQRIHYVQTLKSENQALRRERDLMGQRLQTLAAGKENASNHSRFMQGKGEPAWARTHGGLME